MLIPSHAFSIESIYNCDHAFWRNYTCLNFELAKVSTIIQLALRYYSEVVFYVMVFTLWYVGLVRETLALTVHHPELRYVCTYIPICIVYYSVLHGWMRMDIPCLWSLGRSHNRASFTLQPPWRCDWWEKDRFSHGDQSPLRTRGLGGVGRDGTL